MLLEPILAQIINLFDHATMKNYELILNTTFNCDYLEKLEGW